MENYDYVVLIDENGQPYIAHSFKSRVSSGWGKVKGAGKRAYGAARTAGSKAHKYMLKIGKGAKAQYAYTQEEVDRLLGRGRRAAKNTGEKISSGAKKAGAAVKRAGIKAADKLGVDESIRLYKAAKHYTEAPAGSSEAAVWDQRGNDAARDLLKTPIGKLVGGGIIAARYTERTAKRVRDTIEDYGDVALDAIKSAGTGVKDFAKEAGASAIDFAKEAGASAIDFAKEAGSAVKRAGNKAADKLGVDERYRLKNAEDLVRSFKEGIDKGEKPTASTLKGAYDYLATARKDYADTPLGKAEGAARKAGAAAKAAANKIDETIDTARQNAADRREASRKAKYAASRMGDSEAGQTRADSRTTKAVMNYNNALKEYNKVQNTGGEDEASAYWALVAAEREYERITGQKPPKRGK